MLILCPNFLLVSSGKAEFEAVRQGNGEAGKPLKTTVRSKEKLCVAPLWATTVEDGHRG